MSHLTNVSCFVPPHPDLIAPNTYSSPPTLFPWDTGCLLTSGSKVNQAIGMLLRHEQEEFTADTEDNLTQLEESPLFLTLLDSFKQSIKSSATDKDIDANATAFAARMLQVGIFLSGVFGQKAFVPDFTPKGDAELLEAAKAANRIT